MSGFPITDIKFIPLMKMQTENQLFGTSIVAMSTAWEEESCVQEVFDVVEAIERCKYTCRLMSLNTQSLSGHACDPVLKMADILAFSETWADHVEIEGFTSIAAAKRDNVLAAGVSILQKNSATTMAVPHTIRKVHHHDIELGLSDDYGDICAAEITIMQRRALLVCIYISPGTTSKQKKYFMTRNFFHYQTETMPMIVVGNFNHDLTKEENIEFADFLEKFYKLKLASDPAKATNLDGSCVDLTFTRNIRVESRSYGSCQYHHRPILSVLEC